MPCKYLQRCLRNLICVGLLCSHPVLAQWDISTAANVYAVGDVHGAYTELVDLLRGNGLIDDQLNWRGGDNVLVSVGDLLDRGPDSRKVQDLFMRLQQQTQEAPGTVVVVLGNHEVMNLLREFRDVSQAEIAAFGQPADYAHAMSSAGQYGRWMAGLPAMVKVNDSVFVHGGLTPEAAAMDLNARVKTAIGTIQSYGEQLVAAQLLAPQVSYVDAIDADLDSPAAARAAAGSLVLGEYGPLWYRGNAGCHPLLERTRVEQALATLKASRIVVGHTPTPQREVVSRFDGQVVLIDTGMLRQTYRGQSRLLRINGDSLVVLDAAGQAVPIQQEVSPNREPSKVNPAQASRLKTRQKKAYAAYLLDQWLGLNLVIPFEVGVENTIFPESVLTEVSRQQRGWRRPSYCGDRSDYDLVSVFDSLIGKLDRSGADLGYDPRSWQIRLTNHGGAFVTGAGLPEYAQPPKLPATLADRLQQLDETTLANVVNGLLKKRQMRALLKRRDKILSWPVVE